MTIRRLLIFAPLVLLAFLVQSYFWVPSYEEQTRGNPRRLNDYIEGSIGDAHLLNPILSSDTASSSIESLVFEGLIDRDRDLKWRGRLARKWEIYEQASFYINEKASPPGRQGNSPEEILDLLEQARAGELALDDRARASIENIVEIEILPPKNWSEKIPIQADGKDAPALEVAIHAPAAIRLTLSEVDQGLFDSLSRVLGPDYFGTFPAQKHIEFIQTPSKETGGTDLEQLAQNILPATEHNPVIIFYLRPGVKFHDGHAVDAQDVKFTYEAIMNPANLSPRTADYEPVKYVEVLDPLTIKIVYKRLYSSALGSWAMGVLPRHLLNREALEAEAVKRGRSPEKYGMRDSLFNRNPLGCGPFTFKEWKSDRHIILEKFPDYWEGAPAYDRYVYRIIPDLLTQEMEFYAGTLDSYGVQPHQVDRLKEDPRFQYFSGLSFSYSYIGYNCRREPFNDPRVRKALGMAIDVNKIIEYVLYGQAERITGPFLKQTDFYNTDIRPLPFDPEAALTLLKEAGWEKNAQGRLVKNGKPMEFTLITNGGNDLRKAIAAVAQDAWRKLGAEVRTDILEWSVFIQERVDKADFDTLVLGWSMGIDPDLFQIWHSSQTGHNQLNFAGYKNPKADELIVKIRREYDHDRQVAMCHRLHEIIAEDQPYTFLYAGKWSAVLDKRIVLLEKDENGNRVYRKIEPTRTGNYKFDFNRWIKLPKEPVFESNG